MIPTDTAPAEPRGCITINAAGYSATADAYARDPQTDGLWFLSMVGPQTALKAIWASLLKQPPDTAHIIRGIEGMALSPADTSPAAFPTTPSAPGPPASPVSPPVAAGTRSLYTRLAEFSFERDDFLLLAQDEADLPGLHHRFLDRRSSHAPAPFLGRLALAAGAGHRRDSPAGVQRHPGLHLQSRGRRTQGRPVGGGFNGEPDPQP